MGQVGAPKVVARALPATRRRLLPPHGAEDRTNHLRSGHLER